MTQEEAADAMGVPVNNLRQLMSGRRPMKAVVKKLSDFFGVSVEWLTTGEGKGPSPSPVSHTPTNDPESLILLRQIASDLSAIRRRLDGSSAEPITIPGFIDPATVVPAMKS